MKIVRDDSTEKRDIQNVEDKLERALPDMEAKKSATALQVWNEVLKNYILDQMYQNLPRNKSHINIEQMQQRVNNAVVVAARFEVAKQTILIDRVIEAIEHARKHSERALAEYKALLWIQFYKRRDKRAEVTRAVIAVESYKTALLIIANTLPPRNAEGSVE